MTVAELRAKLADIADDVPVLVRGWSGDTGADYQNVAFAGTHTVTWMDEDEPYDRLSLVIE